MPKGEHNAARNKLRAGPVPCTDTTWIVWKGMRDRCNKPNCKDYPRYGGRGIAVCERWAVFANFFADMGPRPEGMSLDRIDNSQGYAPENCRWASNKEQARNKRSNKIIEFRGEAKPVAQWAEDLGIERKTLQMRLNAWTVERALTTPYAPRKEKTHGC